jgi:hypothetical protein
MSAKKEWWGTTSSKNLINDIDFIYIWAFESWWNYYWQINDIIDYVKIYKD